MTCECGGTPGYEGHCSGCGTYYEEHDQAAADDLLLAGVRNGPWLSAQDFPPLRWAVPGLVPEGLTFLAGPPKVGKSWLVCDLLLSVAGGGYALGAIPAVDGSRKVLYAALEDGDRRMRDRCEALYGYGGSLPEEFNYIIRVERDGIIAALEAWLRRNPDTALIVLDTLGRVMPRAQQGESSYERDYRIGERLKRIADHHPGVALTVVHHTRKTQGEDFVDSMSGTQGLAGSADAVMVLRRSRGDAEGTLAITGRDVSEGEYALKMAEGRFWTLDGKDLAEAAKNARKREESKNLGDRSSEILEFVTAMSGPVRAKQVTEKFGPDSHQYLKRLTDSGRLDKRGRGLYAVPDLSEPSEVSDSQLSVGGEDE